MESIIIIGSAGSVGHDIMYQIASMGLPIKVIGGDIYPSLRNEPKS